MPRDSVLIGCWNNAETLPRTIESILGQTVADLELIVVDDGSTDGSLDLLRTWSRNTRFRVSVFTQPNGGQASARNLGLDHATGEWVTFPDADDVLDRDYLRSPARFAVERPSVQAMSARPVLLDEATGKRSLGHPRRWQYLDGNRIADLVNEPNVFFGLASGSFFRLDRIAAAGLRFDPRIRPNFEDAHFAVRYLLGLPSPQIGLIADSMYIYRKRAAGTSTLQRSMADPARYSTVLELGYLDVVERSRTASGEAPEWIQQLLTYELSWYLSEDDKVATSVRLPADMQPRFDELFDRVLRELDPAVVERHAVRPLKPAWRDILAHAGRGQRWHSAAVAETRHDAAMRLRRLQFRFAGEPPAERFRAGDADVAPAFAKTMAHRYLGRDLLFERIVWLPDARELAVDLDGRPVRIVRVEGEPPGVFPPASGPWSPVRRPDEVARLARRAVRRAARGVERPVVRAIARFGPIRRRYANAWVVMDRIHDADDNGERLFEHLRAERPDLNAWFVLERRSADWARLASTHAGRLVAHGSLSWRLLLLNAAWLASSHADLAVVRPPQITRTEPNPGWKVAFLQHGVIKDDLSRWLNDRELDLFVTSTEAECSSVAADGTPYRFGEKEVVETGLPRFDRLLAIGRETPRSARDLVLVAPTWRSWLSRPLAAGSQRREVEDPFWDSTYLRAWLALLRSEAVTAAVRERGWRLGFMPHPNLQRIVPALHLPAGVEALAFEGTDVQRLYARCALLITDYSSVVFNTAYLDRPAVYFQFDRDEVLGGGHVGRRGYFDYQRDGFGPVADDLEAAEAAIVAAIRAGARPTPEYQARIDAAFPSRDGRACARVVEAMERRGRPWAPSA